MLDIYTDMDWEMKILNIQRAEFKDTPEIKVKNWCSMLVHFAEISMQQLMVLSSVYGPLVLVCMHALNETTDGVPSSQIWTRPSLSSWTVWGVTWTET